MGVPVGASTGVPQVVPRPEAHAPFNHRTSFEGSVPGATLTGRHPASPVASGFMPARSPAGTPGPGLQVGQSHLPGVNIARFRGLRWLVTSGAWAPKPGLLQSQAPRLPWA